MKPILTRTLQIGVIALFSHGTSTAGGLIEDFRLELQWRTQNRYEDFDAAIVLYEQSHYRGRSLVLYPGEQIDNFDDYEWGFRVRSIDVIGPVSTVLFDETGLWGHQLEVDRDIPDLYDYRMRLNNYSSFRWYNRARSAYVTYRNPEASLSIRIGPGRILPRIYCARPISPRYYWIPQPGRYHQPRPQWYHERRVVSPPPPRTKTYRPPRARPPTVSPPGRPPGVPPRTTPPGAPPRSVQGLPPKRNGSPATQPPGRTAPHPPPTARPPTRSPDSAPATRPPAAPRTAPPARNESSGPPSATPPPRSSNSRKAPPPPR